MAVVSFLLLLPESAKGIFKFLQLVFASSEWRLWHPYILCCFGWPTQQAAPTVRWQPCGCLGALQTFPARTCFCWCASHVNVQPSTLGCPSLGLVCIEALHPWDSMIPENQIFTLGISPYQPLSPPASSPSSSPSHHFNFCLYRCHHLQLIMTFIFMLWGLEFNS